MPSDALLGDDSVIGTSTEVDSACDLQSVPGESTAVSVATPIDLEPEPCDAGIDFDTDTDTQTTSLVLHVRTMVDNLAAESLRTSREEAQWSWNSAYRREDRHRPQPASSHLDPSDTFKKGRVYDSRDAPDVVRGPEEVQKRKYDAGWQPEQPDNSNEHSHREYGFSEATNSTNATKVVDQEERTRQAVKERREEQIRAIREYEQKQELDQMEREESARRAIEEYKHKVREEQQEQERLKLQFKLEEEERREEEALKRRQEEETIARERDLRIRELELQVKRAEAARLEAEEEATALKPKRAPPPVLLKDAVGRKFSFPYDIVKTWKGMEGMIQQAFMNVDLLGPHVMEGHYDLIGPVGEIILPQVWETTIEPDMLIERQMWPISEEAKKHQSHGPGDLDALLKGVRLGSAKGNKKPGAPPTLKGASISGPNVLSKSFWARSSSKETI